jgi:hypothetical protein
VTGLRSSPEAKNRSPRTPSSDTAQVASNVPKFHITMWCSMAPVLWLACRPSS